MEQYKYNVCNIIMLPIKILCINNISNDNNNSYSETHETGNHEIRRS